MARNVLMYGMRQPCAVARLPLPRRRQGPLRQAPASERSRTDHDAGAQARRPMTEEEERMRLQEARDLGMV